MCMCVCFSVYHRHFFLLSSAGVLDFTCYNSPSVCLFRDPRGIALSAFPFIPKFSQSSLSSLPKIAITLNAPHVNSWFPSLFFSFLLLQLICWVWPRQPPVFGILSSPSGHKVERTRPKKHISLSLQSSDSTFSFMQQFAPGQRKNRSMSLQIGLPKKLVRKRTTCCWVLTLKLDCLKMYLDVD